ncbi:MAG: class II fumarate hydratase [Microthrixaceae bacterium]
MAENGTPGRDTEPPTIRLDLPVGIEGDAAERTETDGIGAVAVPADRYWGAQTQRAVENFAIGGDSERMPIEVIHAYGLIKAACAKVNGRSGRLPLWKAELIEHVAQEVASGVLDDEFPVRIWQTGSGTQTNMNVNEVISNRAIQLAGGELGTKVPVHPNDDVNASQSSNDTFPTAMHVAADALVQATVLPALGHLADTLGGKAQQWREVVKIGRTHLQDATPLTVGQEWSGFEAMVRDSATALAEDSGGLLRLAIGGTAVGTGLNTREGFDSDVCAELAQRTGRPFEPAPNKFAANSANDAVVRCSSALRNVAVVLFKLANDFRWLGSGPRTGLGELRLPSNEPGSSIMPGKVNPTQAEALQMVALQVMGNDATVAMAGKDGNLQLNTLRPVSIANLIRSMRLIADGVTGFTTHMVVGTELNLDAIEAYVGRSAMLVTALAPQIGYDLATEIAHVAVDEDLPLRDAALQSGVDPDLYDSVVQPLRLTHPVSED